MSPVQDLVVWEMMFRRLRLLDIIKNRKAYPGWKIGDLKVTCVFCMGYVGVVPKQFVNEGFNFHELLRYAKHECPMHHLALGHVLYARGRNPNGKFTPSKELL